MKNKIKLENEFFIDEKSLELSREGLRTLVFSYKNISID